MIICKRNSRGQVYAVEVSEDKIHISSAPYTGTSRATSQIKVRAGEKTATVAINFETVPSSRDKTKGYITRTDGTVEELIYSGDTCNLDSQNPGAIKKIEGRITPATSVRLTASQNLSNLTDLHMPFGVSTGTYNFLGCEQLSSLCLGDSSTVGRLCFSRCGIAYYLVLPYQVISRQAFSYCLNLQVLYVHPTARIQVGAFGGCPLGRLYTDTGSANRLRASDWYAALPAPKPQIIEI